MLLWGNLSRFSLAEVGLGLWSRRSQLGAGDLLQCRAWGCAVLGGALHASRLHTDVKSSSCPTWCLGRWSCSVI